VLLLAVWNAFFIPLELAFKDELEKKALDNIHTSEYFVDSCFIVDIFLMFFTSYQNKEGKEVKKNLMIWGAYVGSPRFLTDFFSLFALIPDDRFKIFGFLKMLRVFRLSFLIKRLNVRPDIKNFYLLAKVSFYLFLWLHVQGCFLWAVVVINKDVIDDYLTPMQWYPPLDWINFVDSIIFDSNKAGFSYKYLMSLYYSVLILGSNEIGPVNTEEFMFIVTALILSLFTNAFLVSDISGILSDFSKGSTAF
jgi:hypothetical protein